MIAVALIVGIAINLAVQYPEYGNTAGPILAAPSGVLSHCPLDEATVKKAESVERIVKFGRRIGKKDEAEMRRIAEAIVRFSYEYGVEPELAAALIAKESRFNPRAHNPGDGMGLGQLNPGTAKRLGVTAPFDLEQGTRGAVRYLRGMMDIWKDKPDKVAWALASYNAGSGAVRRRGPEVSRKFINSILKYREEMINY